MHMHMPMHRLALIIALMLTGCSSEGDVFDATISATASPVASRL